MVHSETYSGTQLDGQTKCVMEWQQVQYGAAYEIVEKLILKIIHCNNVGFLDLSAILTISFTNKYF